MSKHTTLSTENKSLKEKLQQAEDTLTAIREGDVDAVVVHGTHGEQIYSLKDTVINNILRATAEGIFGVDETYTCTFINEAAVAMFGYTEEEYIGKNLHALIHYKYADGKPYPKIKCPMHMAFTKGEAIRLQEEVFWKKDGTPVEVLISFSPMFQGKNVVGGVGTIVDITERNIAKQILKKTQDQYKLVVENTSDLIVMLDTQGIIEYVSPSVTEILGYTPEELLGKNSFFFTHPDDAKKVQKEMSAVLHKKNANVVYRAKHKNGHWVILEGKGSAIYNEKGEPYLIVSTSRDVTGRVELEQRKDEFISMASHELKTPVTSIKLFLEVLNKSVTKSNDEKAGDLIKKLEKQTDKLKELVNNLLDVSRIQSGKLLLEKETFSLDSLIQEIVEGLAGTTTKHHIVFENREKISITADRFRIYQVITNLLTNAIKYSPKGGRICVSLFKDTTFATVKVEDDGLGIAKKDQGKIFERLYQAKNSEVNTFPGLGMGLYISKDIIERHKGKIWVESKKGKGSTFYFSLPL